LDNCITGFMKQIKCNATPLLNIKTTTKQVLFYFIRRTHRCDHKSSDCFEYQKNPYLNQASPKNICQIFLPKKSRNRKCQPPKKHSIIPETWNPGYPPPGFPQGERGKGKGLGQMGWCYVYVYSHEFTYMSISCVHFHPMTLLLTFGFGVRMKVPFLGGGEVIIYYHLLPNSCVTSTFHALDNR